MEPIKCKISIQIDANNPAPSVLGEVQIKEVNEHHIVDIAVRGAGTGAVRHEIPVMNIKPLERPANKTAKSCTLDVMRHKILNFKLTFESTQQLNDALNQITKYIKEADPKKTIKKSCMLSEPVNSPVYSKPVPFENVNKQDLITKLKRPKNNNCRLSSYNAKEKTFTTFVPRPNTAEEDYSGAQKVKSMEPSRKRILENTNNALGFTLYSDEEDDPTEVGFSKSNIHNGEAKKAKKEEPSTYRNNTEEETSAPYRPSTETMEVDQPKPIAFPAYENYSNCYAHRRMFNLGNSCYMNSSLQALASAPEFVTAFLKAVPYEFNSYEESIKPSDLLYSVSRFFRHIYCSADAPSMVDIKNIRKREGKTEGIIRDTLEELRAAAGAQIEESMGFSVQHDAQEFISQLLDITHDEIAGTLPAANRKQVMQVTEASIEEDPMIDEANDEDEINTYAFLDKLSDIEPVVPSIKAENPGKLFNIVCYNRLVCNSCGYNCKNCDSAREIPIGINEQAEPSIYDFLKSQFERHRITWKCPKCNQLDAAMSTAFKTLPECLVIVLKRYVYNDYGGSTKSNTRVKVDYHLALKELCEGSDSKNAELSPMPLEVQEVEEDKMEEVVPVNSYSSPVKSSLLDEPSSSTKKGFAGKSPVKTFSNANRVLFPKGSSSSSQTDVFDDIEESIFAIDTKNASPTITDETQAHNIEEKLEDNDYDANKENEPENMDENLPREDYATKRNYQKGGGKITVINSNCLTPSPTQVDSDTQVIYVDEASSKTIFWHILTNSKKSECKARIDLEGIPSRKNRWEDDAIAQIPVQMGSHMLSVSSTVGDGNCLFRSFSYLIFGHQEHHDIIRNRTCEFLSNFKEEFIGLFENGVKVYNNFDEYITFMSSNGSWGTHIEIWAFATMMCTTVFSHHEGVWKRFEPRFSWHTTDDGIKVKNELLIEAEEDVEQHGAFYIQNQDDQHFEPVVSINSFGKMHYQIQDNYDDVFLDPAYNPTGQHEFSPEAVVPGSPEPGATTPPAHLSDNEDNRYEVNCQQKPSNYCPSENDGPVYTLSAVVNHHGAYLNHGHYTSYSFDPERNVWLDCDDSTITEVSARDVLERSMDSGYVFIYRKRNVGDEAQFKLSH